MTKKMIEEVVEDYSNLDCYTLKEAIERLQSDADYYGETARISSKYDGEARRLVLKRTREETDFECNFRITQETAAQQKREEHERKQLEKLLAKYGTT